MWRIYFAKKCSCKGLRSFTGSKTAKVMIKSGITSNFNKSPVKSGTGIKKTKLGGSMKESAKIRVISGGKFEVNVSQQSPVNSVLSQLNTVQYDDKRNSWTFSSEAYSEVVRELRHNDVSLAVPPKLVLDILLRKEGSALQDVVIDWSKIDPKLRSSLMPFQIEGVKYCVKRNGRAVIADDMGLGKTLQAIAVMSMFKEDWPLLIVCPSSVKYVWSGALMQWLPSMKSLQVDIITTGKDVISHNPDVVIISYGLATKLYAELLRREFKAVVLDESHYIKGLKTKRYSVMKKLTKRAKRLLLLSGTPALSRPQELYSQLSLLLDISYITFGFRYCAGYKSTFGLKFDGASNLLELQALLQESCMVRRLKSEVLQQLPIKRRQVVFLESLESSENADSSEGPLSYYEKTSMTAEAIMKAYSVSGLYKVQGSMQFILDFLEEKQKLIVFAHHRAIVDIIGVGLEAKGHHYVKFDGTVTSLSKKKAVEEFTENNDCRVIILSVTSGSAGIDLTAASDVVFAEMFWNPGTLIQAEDRAYRIGQTNTVNIYYMMCDSFIDNFMWSLLQKKISILTDVGVSLDNFPELMEKQSKDYEKTGHDNLKATFDTWIKEESNHHSFQALPEQTNQSM